MNISISLCYVGVEWIFQLGAYIFILVTCSR